MNTVLIIYHQGATDQGERANRCVFRNTLKDSQFMEDLKIDENDWKFIDSGAATGHYNTCNT